MLPEGVTASTEPQTFGGIPGLYPPGEPVFLDDTELSDERAREIAADEGNPLELVEASEPRGKPIESMDRSELAELAAEAGIEVTRAEGEGEPTKADYLRVLGASNVEVTGRTPLPVAGRHYDEEALEPGESVPILPSGTKVASAPEGFLPDGSPLVEARPPDEGGQG